MNRFNKILAILIVLIPLNTFAYSNKIILGGDSIGINIKTNGVMIVGFYKVNGKTPIGAEKLKLGDLIKEVNGNSVNTTDDLVNVMKSNMKDNKVTLKVQRDNKYIDVNLQLSFEDNSFKTGLYVKDSVIGIGTISYIDPNTRIYGALGHEVKESNSGYKIEVKDGAIFKSVVLGIDKSYRGKPGGKNANFFKDSIYGSINKNSKYGIYGKYDLDIDKDGIYISSLDDVKLGSAYIYTVLDGEKKEKFEINITKIDKQSDLKNIHFEVVSKELLDKTGGIVQGMSGSPIVQDNKLIGAVTHVVVSDPKFGYGIGIIKMLEEGEK